MASQEIMQQKRVQIDDIKERIANAKGLVLVEYVGLTVEQDTALRKELRENNIHYAVLKNRFVKIAFNELGFKDFDDALNGPTAVAFSSEDVVAPAKSITACVDKYPKLKVKCGLADGTYLDEAGVKALSKIPSKEILVANMLGSLQSPISNFVYCLNGVISGLAVCLNKIAEQKA